SSIPEIALSPSSTMLVISYDAESGQPFKALLTVTAYTPFSVAVKVESLAPLIGSPSLYHWKSSYTLDPETPIVRLSIVMAKSNIQSLNFTRKASHEPAFPPVAKESWCAPGVASPIPPVIAEGTVARPVR